MNVSLKQVLSVYSSLIYLIPLLTKTIKTHQGATLLHWVTCSFTPMKT